MDPQTIYNLIQKYKDNTASDSEKQELLDWYRSTVYKDAQFPEDEASANDYIFSRLPPQKKPRSRFFIYCNWGLAAASVIIAALGIGKFLISHEAKNTGQKQALNRRHDILPGSNKAILTLANGTKISLTDIKNGAVASQRNVRIIKLANGQLKYSFQLTDTSEQLASKTIPAVAIQYNTIETPRGGQFQIDLPDGTHVWLNAMSSIRFPLNFSSLKERRVELTGEAYFEVVHNKDLPFRVVTTSQTVEDLGTLFDVNAYSDEKRTKTTLLRGSVKLTAGNNSVVLIPGQQAETGQSITVHEADVEAAIAWKNGYFKFDDEKLEDIMRQLGRWYNINVVYQDESVRSETFGVLTTRFANISSLLNMLEQTGNVKFRISGSTVTISK